MNITALEVQNDPMTRAAATLQLEVLSEQSKRVYLSDVRAFRNWLDSQGIDIQQIGGDVMLEYRDYLYKHYAKTTVGRMFVVARRLLEVAVDKGLIDSNPATKIKIKGTSNDSSPHTALSKREARKLLAAVDTSTAKGKRDFAILMVLVYAGLRRAELAATKLGDIVNKQEHNVLTVKHGKGDKRRDVPLRADVFRSIKAYLTAIDRLNDSPDSLLFQGFFKGDKSSGRGLTDKAIELLVKGYGAKVGLTITPHDLRATFITLAIDTGSPLIQVQRLAGHSSPSTTERYYSRKQDLDTSPVYRIDLNS